MRFFLTSAVSALAITSATAADVYSRGSLKDAPAPVYEQSAGPSWTRIYLGAGLQGDAVNHDIKATEVEGFGAELDGLGAMGAGAVLIAGADYQIGNRFVIGAQLQFHDVGGKVTCRRR